MVAWGTAVGPSEDEAYVDALSHRYPLYPNRLQAYW